MNLKKVKPSTIAVIVAALLILLVGTYTENNGFRLAGVLVLLGGVVMAFTEARKRDG